MIKHFFWILLLIGCHSSSDADRSIKISSFSDSSSTRTTEKKSGELKKSAILFDNHQPFEIVSVTNTLNKHTSDTDTSKCSRWTLTKPDIEKIIQNSEPIDGTTWDLSFSVLTCTKVVGVVQSGHQFKVEINAASFFLVDNGDSSVLFGDYKKSDRKYFIESPDNK